MKTVMLLFKLIGLMNTALINSVQFIFNRIVVRKNHASIRELVWTLIPTFILLMIAIPSL